MPRSIVNKTKNNLTIEYAVYNQPGSANFKPVSNHSGQSTFSEGKNFLVIKVKKEEKFGTVFLNGINVTEMHFLSDHPRFKGYDVYIFALTFDSNSPNDDLNSDDVELIPPEDSHPLG